MKSSAEFRDLWLNDDIREPFDNCLDKYQVIQHISDIIGCRCVGLLVRGFQLNVLLTKRLLFCNAI